MVKLKNFVLLQFRFTNLVRLSNIEDMWQLSFRGGFYRGGPVLMSALSGIDIALWDLKGKK